jgi:hypothetical protein
VVCVENDTKIKEAIDISIAQKVLYISMPFEEPCMKRFLSRECELIASAKACHFHDEVAEYATIWNQATKKIGLSGRE